jgi:hypothetical protein
MIELYKLAGADLCEVTTSANALIAANCVRPGAVSLCRSTLGSSIRTLPSLRIGRAFASSFPFGSGHSPDYRDR